MSPVFRRTHLVYAGIYRPVLTVELREGLIMLRDETVFSSVKDLKCRK